ncbi:MAG: protein tyrosine phosphatase [Flavobacteriales bacterium]|nr:protein tyrosine phosphatase [Flavobacteriales bacterium]
MNILSVCTENKDRSRTAETMFGQSEEHVVRSAGTSSTARIQVTESMLLWADVVFCMENKHKEILKKRFQTATRDIQITVLHIEDEYNCMQSELIEELEEATSQYF